ncbi:hypothetical protein RJ640_002926 [Escallonia rubra]|uniref:ADP-ribosyl cyclase/cyclic ADP-ribose hydrolase n=1 Tax=Escallonia rubra TaxID=112253 RepID=A0AA88QPQ7_9ASTE|nr:hypothetical protein RJ640_002926 [Escallonia rubra]
MATKRKHDVFICFRGIDCRAEFLDYLVESLKRAGIVPFTDTKTKKGGGLWPQLETAIEESWSSIIIMSKRFATSKWCLLELEKILEKKRTSGLPVMPIFYRLNTSHSKKQKKKQQEKLARAFAKHEKKEGELKANSWKDALAELGGLVRWVFPGTYYR